jgi:hypothetical protein
MLTGDRPLIMSTIPTTPFLSFGLYCLYCWNAAKIPENIMPPCTTSTATRGTNVPQLSSRRRLNEASCFLGLRSLKRLSSRNYCSITTTPTFGCEGSLGSLPIHPSRLLQWPLISHRGAPQDLSITINMTLGRWNLWTEIILLMWPSTSRLITCIFNHRRPCSFQEEATNDEHKRSDDFYPFLEA